MFDTLTAPEPTETGPAAGPSGPDAGPDRERRVRGVLTRAQRVAVQVSVGQAQLVDLAGELLDDEGALGSPPAEVLALHCRLSPAEARRVVRLAKRLRELPLVAAAFRAGQLSEDTVVAIARVATPENEAWILEVARTATAGQLQTLLRSYQRARPKPAPRDEPEPEPEERLSHGLGDDGMWRATITLRPERGAVAEAALRAAKEHLFAQRQDEARDDVVEAGGELAARPPVSGADAFVHLAERYLTTCTTADGKLPERFLVLIHLDEQAARTGVATDDQCHIQGGGPISPATVAGLLDQALVSYVVTKRGRPVTVTVPQRYATLYQYLALLVRDRCCRYPGCGRPGYLKAHHLLPASERGPTRLSNLCLLCQTHHTQVHRPGWAITGHPDIPPGRSGAPRFITPDGTPVPDNALRDQVDTRDALDELDEVDGLGTVDVEGRAPTSYDPLTQDAASDIIGWWMTN